MKSVGKLKIDTKSGTNQRNKISNGADHSAQFKLHWKLIAKRDK